MNIYGHVDGIEHNAVTGWVVNKQELNRRCTVAAYLDGRLISEVVADMFREDLKEQGIGDGLHAFRLPIPCSLDSGMPIEIKEKETGTMLIGSPIEAGSAKIDQDKEASAINIELPPDSHPAKYRGDIRQADEIQNLSSFIDLNNNDCADAMIDTHLVAKHRQALSRAICNAPTNAEKVGILLDRMAVMSAQIEKLSSYAAHFGWMQTEMVRIDPLSEAPEVPTEMLDAPPPAFFEADLTSRFIGVNWYPVEQDGPLTWRWSGPNQHSTIILPSLGGGKLRVVLELTSGDGAPIETNLMCMLAGVQLVLANKPNTRVWVADVEIEQVPPLSQMVLHFDVQKMFSPADSGGQDRRQLGVAIWRCRIEQRA